MIKLHEGQGNDIYWRDNHICPDEDQYIEMVKNSKVSLLITYFILISLETGGLLRLGIKLMQDSSSNDINCIPLVNLLGIYYQIRDDLMNLCSDTVSYFN